MNYTPEQLRRIKRSLGLTQISLDEAITEMYTIISTELKCYPIYPTEMPDKAI